MFRRLNFNFLGLLLLANQSICLRIINMTAPTIHDPRNQMHLYCKFDMGGEDLYAVKWYKDDHEFFRYAPTGPRIYVEYPVPGVTVDTKKSQCTREACDLTLTELHRPYSSGAYRCEVSSEAPAFRLASQTYNITVAALPKDPPTISGLSDNYQAGDLIQAICTSGLGDPQPRLTWYVNKQAVPSKTVKNLPAETVTDKQNDKIKLKNSVLQLRLALDKKLTGKEPSSNLEVKCVASTDGIGPSLAVPLSTVRNIMVVDEHMLVNNQKLHWPDSSSQNNVAICLFVFILAIFALLC